MSDCLFFVVVVVESSCNVHHSFNLCLVELTDFSEGFIGSNVI